MLKRTGIDGIIFEGSSPEPVYLWVQDDLVELREAKNIRGRDTHKTDDRLREEIDPKTQGLRGWGMDGRPAEAKLKQPGLG
jgi:aldehyde:ferredoxin oxidoreductase